MFLAAMATLICGRSLMARGIQADVGTYGVTCFTKQYMNPQCVTFDTRSGHQVGSMWSAEF